MNGKRSNLLESGQAIFVVALIMIGLIGALGLAVDGGGLAFLYRDAQNAADAAALAAAYARCTGGDVNLAATTAARDNGFVTSATNTITVQSPPTSGTGAGDSNFVSVTVSATKPAYFIQLLYPGGLQASAGAVGRCEPAVNGSASGSNYAIFGSGPQGGVSASCHSAAGICREVEANSLTIDGNVHANGELWVSGVSNLNGTTRTNATTTGTYRADPLASITFAQFDQGGSVWNRVPAAQRIQRRDASNLNKTWTLTNPSPGLYVYYGSVNVVSTSTTPMNVTIVATGEIRICGSNCSNPATPGMRPFIDNMLAFSTENNGNLCDTTTSIYIRTSGDNYGIVYSPKGQQEILYTASGTWTGFLNGQYVDWYQSSGAATLRSIPLAQPPRVSLAT